MSISLEQTVLHVLEDTKAKDIINLDVRNLTDITDSMIICSGTSKQHLRTLADKVRVKAKEMGVTPIGVEGQDFGEWVLVDLTDVVVHIMLPQVREFYSLEKLWATTQKSRANEA